MNDKEKLAAMLKTIEVIKAGYGGMLPNGNIVDRREHPDALPIQKNAMLGAPEPRPLDGGPDIVPLQPHERRPAG
jgi:hypothetical protein